MISYEIAQYFQSATDLTVMGLSVAAWQMLQKRGAEQIINRDKTYTGVLVIILALYSLVIGARPLSGALFGDTFNYAQTFMMLKNHQIVIDTDQSEWLFNLLSVYCARYLDVTIYFTIIAFGYIFLAFAGIKRIFRNNTYVAMLFYIGAFSFFSYATNGIRNGLGCAFVILAMSFLATDKNRNYILFALISFLAFSIHKSTALPIVCCTAALFIRNPRPLVFFWFFSIILSVVARGAIESFFSGLGFDDRLSGYIQGGEEYAEMGFKSGFRPDFLLYSFMPILLGMKVLAKVGTKDRTYCFLLATYIMANSFWVMLMNAAYSNRFAYLSWFMYPIVIAYPCLRMNVWGNRQGQVAGTILLAHSAFTVFMMFIYY